MKLRKKIRLLLCFLLLCTGLVPQIALAAEDTAVSMPPGQYGNIIIGEDGRLVPNAESRVVTFETGKTPTETIYIATDGNDLSGKGTIDSPYKTFKKALTLANPGTSILAKPGTYAPPSSVHLYIEDLRGTADAPIWIGGIPGEERPVLSGGKEGIKMSRGAYVIFHDLEITGVTENGVNVDGGEDHNSYTGGEYFIFRNMYVHDIGSGGNDDNFKFSGINHYYVYDCEASFGGSPHSSGIDQVGCHYALIFGNYFHNLEGNAVTFKGGSFDADITQNLMFNAGARAVIMGGTSDLNAWRPSVSTTEPNYEAMEVRTYSNLIIGAEAGFAFVSAKDCYAVNNTVVKPQRYLFRILQEGDVAAPCEQNTIANNIFYYDSAVAYPANIGSNTKPETFIMKNNLYFNVDAPTLAPSIGIKQENPLSAADPLFKDAERFDFRLTANSPARKTGVTFSFAKNDFSNLSFAATPSLGAMEFRMVGDTNQDGTVNICDIALWFLAKDSKEGQPDYNTACDINADGAVDKTDFDLIKENI